MGVENQGGAIEGLTHTGLTGGKSEGWPNKEKPRGNQVV